MQGFGAFGHAAWMPRDRNRVTFSFEGGLHYVGAIPGRGKDALGLGVAWIGLSDRVAAAVRETNRRDLTWHRPPDYEATIELVYRYQVAPWFSIQPHLQYVFHAGGTTESDDALILGIRTNISF